MIAAGGSKRNDRVPGSERQGPGSLALLFGHGLELAFKIEPSNLPLHWADQPVIHCPGCEELLWRPGSLRVIQGAIGRSVGVIQSERSEADGLKSKGGEEEAGLVRATGLWHKQGIVVAVIQLQDFQVGDVIVLVIVWRQNIQGWRRDFPDIEHIVRGAAALIIAG